MGLKSQFVDDGTLLELVAKAEVPQGILDILNLMARRLVDHQEGRNGVSFGYSRKGDRYFVNGPYSVVIDGYRSEGNFAIGLTTEKRS